MEHRYCQNGMVAFELQKSTQNPVAKNAPADVDSVGVWGEKQRKRHDPASSGALHRLRSRDRHLPD
jgi:hypothetical protein